MALGGLRGPPGASRGVSLRVLDVYFTSAYVCFTFLYVSLRLFTSAYVFLRQLYVFTCEVNAHQSPSIRDLDPGLMHTNGH